MSLIVCSNDLSSTPFVLGVRKIKIAYLNVKKMASDNTRAAKDIEYPMTNRSFMWNLNCKTTETRLMYIVFRRIFFSYKQVFLIYASCIVSPDFSRFRMLKPRPVLPAFLMSEASVVITQFSGTGLVNSCASKGFRPAKLFVKYFRTVSCN